MLRIEVEHTEDGLCASVSTPRFMDDHPKPDREYVNVSGVEVIVDNGIYLLEVVPNMDGGYDLTFSKCEQVLVEGGLTCDWDELGGDR